MTTLSRPTTDIDVFSSDVYVDGIPHEQLAWCREQPGMLLQSIPDPELEDEAFIAARYADLIAVAKDSKHFTITDGHNVRRVRGKSDGRNLLVLDDPDHLQTPSSAPKMPSIRAVSKAGSLRQRPWRHMSSACRPSGSKHPRTIC